MQAIRTLHKGNAFIDPMEDKPKPVTITKIAAGCTRHKVHVNDNQCWDGAYPVEVMK